MKGRGNRLRVLGLVLAGSLALVLVAPEVWSALVANVERVEALRRLDLPVYERSLDEAAWDSGWRSLCGREGEDRSLPMFADSRALGFSALASIDAGQYLTALSLLQRSAEQGQVSNEPNALAYLAALEMDWIEAVRLYDPQATARHKRWWGTVFYRAAQRRMFEGDLEQAANLYRRADTAYGVHGPYLGLGLADCLVQEDRPLEAWDVLRRALVVMPPHEALGYLARFEELRLDGLRAWHERQPGNEQVAHWLAFYEEDVLQERVGLEVLKGESVPQVSIEQELEGGRTLIGFDYRAEDLETGPFMEVELYFRDGQQGQPQYSRVRQVVLNQASNPAFAWDSVPAGVRPVGWHGLVYGDDLSALSREEIIPHEMWLCLDAGRVDASFGLQSDTAPLRKGALYVEGGKAFPMGDAALTLGRIWFGVEDPYNYTHVGGGWLPDQVQFRAGVWEPVADADSAGVWLVAHGTSKGCFREVYLFALGEVDHVGEAE